MKLLPLSLLVVAFLFSGCKKGEGTDTVSPPEGGTGTGQTGGTTGQTGGTTDQPGTTPASVGTTPGLATSAVSCTTAHTSAYGAGCQMGNGIGGKLTQAEAIDFCDRAGGFIIQTYPKCKTAWEDYLRCLQDTARPPDCDKSCNARMAAIQSCTG